MVLELDVSSQLETRLNHPKQRGSNKLELIFPGVPGAMSGVPSAEREWEKVDAKDVLACIQWQPGSYNVKVEENNKPTSQVRSEILFAAFV